MVIWQNNLVKKRDLTFRSRPTAILAVFLPTATPPVPVIGFLFLSGHGAGCVGGPPDAIQGGSRCAEVKRTLCHHRSFTAIQTCVRSCYYLRQSDIQVRWKDVGF